MDSYKTIKYIGKGVFSEVYLVQHKETEELFAIKRIRNKQEKKYTERELDILKRVNHPNIVSFKEVILEKDSVNILTEYCCKGDLHHFLDGRKMKEKSALHYFYQILQGLNYLHTNNIIHRDIKPQNILIDSDNNCKIADFGFARYDKNESLLNTICGSPLYMAPEIIKKQKYSINADVWSVGVILYQMLTASQPFNCSNFYELSKKVDEGESAIEYPMYISTEVRQLLKEIFTFTEGDRPSITYCLSKVNSIITGDNDIFQMDDVNENQTDRIINSSDLSELSELSESNKLLEISCPPMAASLLDNNDNKLMIPDINNNTLIERKTSSTLVVIKNTDCHEFEDWFSLKKTDYIHKENTEMYYSDPLYSVVTGVNNVMDDGWRMFKKAGNILSDISKNNSI